MGLGTRAVGECFHSFFEFSQTFDEWIYNSIETKRTCISVEKKTFNPLTSKSKQFYRLLVSVKVKTSKGFIKLKEDIDVDDSTAANASLTIKSYSSETLIRSFPFKLLAAITFTNHYLAKICPEWSAYLLRGRINNDNNNLYYLHLFLQLALHFLKEFNSVKRGGGGES